MFFYEWLVPLFIIAGLAVWRLYAAIRNKTGCGIRTEGRIVLDKPVDEKFPPS